MSRKSRAELLEENTRLKYSLENIERRFATLSKWIHLQFDNVPAEIKIVLQYKDYDVLHSRIKDFNDRSGGDLFNRSRRRCTRDLRSSRKKVDNGNNNTDYTLKALDERNLSPYADFEEDPSETDHFMADSGSEWENSEEGEDIEIKEGNISPGTPGSVDSKVNDVEKGEDCPLQTEYDIKKAKRLSSNKNSGEKSKTPKKKNTSTQMTQCNICNKVLATNKSLKHHLKTHSSEKPYLCNECGQSFIAQYYLTCHLRQHIPIAERKKYECEVCGSVQTNKAGFNRHLRRHAGLEQHQCSECGIIFMGRSALRRHIVGVHEKRRPHACHLCEKHFKTRTHLKTHMNVHDEEKPSRNRSLNKDSATYKPRRRIKYPIQIQNYQTSVQHNISEPPGETNTEVTESTEEFKLYDEQIIDFQPPPQPQIPNPLPPFT